MPFVQRAEGFDHEAFSRVFDKLPILGAPLLNISWKSSCVCVGFRCVCGHDTHEDTEYDAMLVLRCGGCGALYVLAHSIQLIPLDPSEVGEVDVFEVTDGVNDEVAR